MNTSFLFFELTYYKSVFQEPKALYDKVRIIPISKIDQTATKDAIIKNINKDLAK